MNAMLDAVDKRACKSMTYTILMTVFGTVLACSIRYHLHLGREWYVREIMKGYNRRMQEKREDEKYGIDTRN